MCRTRTHLPVGHIIHNLCNCAYAEESFAKHVYLVGHTQKHHRLHWRVNLESPNSLTLMQEFFHMLFLCTNTYRHGRLSTVTTMATSKYALPITTFSTTVPGSYAYWSLVLVVFAIAFHDPVLEVECTEVTR